MSEGRHFDVRRTAAAAAAAVQTNGLPLHRKRNWAVQLGCELFKDVVFLVPPARVVARHHRQERLKAVQRVPLKTLTESPIKSSFAVGMQFIDVFLCVFLAQFLGTQTRPIGIDGVAWSVCRWAQRTMYETVVWSRFPMGRRNIEGEGASHCKA